MSGMLTFFSLFIITLSNGLLRCMGHIVNLAQQSFICKLTGGTDDPDPKVPEGGDNDGELDPSGLEESVVGGALVGPLLARVRALVVRVGFHALYRCGSDRVCLDSKVSWCKELLARVLCQSLN